MAQIKNRVSPVMVTFYGQSLNGSPNTSEGVPAQLRAATGFMTYEPWISGIAWVQFARWYQHQIIPQANSAQQTVLVCIGGTTDIASGLSGAAAYGHVQTIATAAKAAGYNFTVNTTLTGWDYDDFADPAGQQTRRNDYNNLVIANSAGFDAVVDVAGHVTPNGLENNLDTTYYNADETHWTTAGATVAANLIIDAVNNLVS